MLYHAAIEQQFRERRRALGLNQREVARRAGLQQAQVSHFERGGDIRLSSLKQLAAALNLELLAVPEGSGPGPDLPAPGAGTVPATSEGEPPSLLDLYGDRDED